jgi:PAS domain S-box-containing protein
MLAPFHLENEKVILLERVDHPNDPGLEIKRLQRCMNDLIGVLALPAAWSGREPVEILSNLVDSLMGMLTLDFFYARVIGEADEKPLELLRAGPSHRTDEIAQYLDYWLNEDPIDRSLQTRCKIGVEEISIFPMRMGVGGELGFIVAGSQRLGFPDPTERLVLSAAANQTAVALQHALLLSEQKRVASELDRRVAERTRALAETNEELQLQVGLLQNLPVSAWTLKPDGTPDFVNRVWLEYSGQTLEFVRSRPEAWMSAVHPEDREAASRSFWDGVRSGRGFAMETRSLRAEDGTYRWHLNQAVVLRDAEGKVLKFVGTTTDIDEQIRAEEELRASEANLRQIVDSIPGLICTMSPTGETEQLNQPLLEYFGKGPEELKGWKMTDAVHPDDLPEVIKAYTYSVKTETPYAIEHRCRRADGAYRWFQARALPARDTDGRIACWYCLITDIDDRKRAEEALSKARSELAHVSRVTTLGELTASIAHEVNQPLSGIVTNATACLRMLAADPADLDGARETARRTIRDGQRASDVIERLRALFRKKSAPTKAVDLNEATEEVIALLSSELQRAELILRVELAEDLPSVAGDRVQLQQVVLNLLLNASEAMNGINDRPRRLTIRTERDVDDGVRLSVADVGVGLPQDSERLFQAFYTTKSGGMGIGLSVSRSIIENHRGRLRADPNGGPGATFSFCIPRIPELQCGAQSLHAAIPINNATLEG